MITLRLFCLGLLLTLTMLQSACVGRDLDVLCEEAEAAVKSGQEPAGRAFTFASQVDKRLSPGSRVGKIMGVLASASNEERYRLLLHAAAELGHPSWRCPAIEELLSPTVPAAE